MDQPSHFRVLCFLLTAKVVRWYKSKGDLVEYEDMLCDIETDVRSERIVAVVCCCIYMALTLVPLAFFCLKEFTFAMVNEEKESAIMGEITVPENSGFVVSEGDVLCTVFRPKTWGS